MQLFCVTYLHLRNCIPASIDNDSETPVFFAGKILQCAWLVSVICCVILFYYPFFQSHTMRVAVCEVLGEILVCVLCGDRLDDSSKADRDRFFDTLQEHLHDTNSHVRARVLQVFTRIVNSKVCKEYSLVVVVLCLFFYTNFCLRPYPCVGTVKSWNLL